MTMEEFSKTVSPHDLRVIVARFDKKWIGDSVSEIASRPLIITSYNS
jgi:hypothetical protein